MPKSTKAMRDRIRELMPKAWDDYDRAVDCVLEDLETSLVRIEALEAALNYVADMTYCGADAEWHFKPGYDPQAVLDALAPEQKQDK